MALKRSLAELRDGLIYSLDKETQIKALNQLGVMDNNPDAIQIIADALKAPQVVIKPAILNTLSTIDRESVYENLIKVIDEGGDTVRWSIYDFFNQAGLGRKYLEKIEKYRQSPDKTTLLAGIIRFIGKLGDQEMMEPIGQVIFTNNDEIRLAVVDALDYLDNRSCLNYLMTAVKLFSPDVAARALEVISKFKDKNSMLPLLYALGEAVGANISGIARVLKTYDQKELLEIIYSNISREDKDLVLASILYLEMIGNIEVARKMREEYNIGTSVAQSQGADAAAHATLEFEVKNIGELVLIGLKGILDLYTLPRLQRVMDAIVTHGHDKVLLMCGSLEKLDRHTSVYLNRINAKLKKMMGGLRFVKLDCLSDVELKNTLPEEDLYTDLPSAASSFSVVRSEKLLRVNDAMIAKDSKIEVTFTTAGVEKNRTTTVLESDQKRIKLSWEVVDKTDVFEEYANDNVKLTLVRDNNVMVAQTRVVEQIHFPTPSIIIHRPRMARVKDRRRAIRINTQFAVKFLKLKSLKEVSKTQLPGLCLNVSAGGILLLTPIKLAEGSIIILVFPQTEIKIGKVLGKIARRFERIEQSKLLYEYGIIFAKIMDNDRMKIKKFIFDQISIGI